jgi:hypothetical protein
MKQNINYSITARMPYIVYVVTLEPNILHVGTKVAAYVIVTHLDQTWNSFPEVSWL